MPHAEPVKTPACGQVIHSLLYSQRPPRVNSANSQERGQMIFPGNDLTKLLSSPIVIFLGFYEGRSSPAVSKSSQKFPKVPNKISRPMLKLLYGLLLV